MMRARGHPADHAQRHGRPAPAHGPRGAGRLAACGALALLLAAFPWSPLHSAAPASADAGAPAGYGGHVMRSAARSAACAAGAGALAGVPGERGDVGEVEVAGVVTAPPARVAAEAVAAPGAIGPGYVPLRQWDGGAGFHALLSGPPEPARGARPEVLQIVQRLPSEELAARFFADVAAAPPSEYPVVTARGLAAGGPAGAAAADLACVPGVAAVHALERRLAVDGAVVGSVVVLARRGASIASVEVRLPAGGPGQPGEPAAEALDLASAVLGAVLARLPA